MPSLGSLASCRTDVLAAQLDSDGELSLEAAGPTTPVAPFPYKRFAARRIDLSLLPYPHEFTQDDLPDYLDIVMGFLLFSRDLASFRAWFWRTLAQPASRCLSHA